MNARHILGFALASVAGYVAVEYAKASGLLDPIMPRKGSGGSI